MYTSRGISQILKFFLKSHLTDNIQQIPFLEEFSGIGDKQKSRFANPGYQCDSEKRINSKAHGDYNFRMEKHHTLSNVANRILTDNF